MATEEEFNKQLEDIVAKIDEAKRELKALRRHPTEGSDGKARASFITGRGFGEDKYCLGRTFYSA